MLMPRLWPDSRFNHLKRISATALVAVSCKDVMSAAQVAEEAVEQLAAAQRQASEAVDEAAQLRGRLATAQQQIKARHLGVVPGGFRDLE